MTFTSEVILTEQQLATANKEAGELLTRIQINTNQLYGTAGWVPINEVKDLLTPLLGEVKALRLAKVASTDLHRCLAHTRGLLDDALATPPAPLADAVLATNPDAGIGGQWLLVSMIEGRGLPYWRPKQAGYTESVVDAGKYSLEVATEVVNGCHGDVEKYCINDPALYKLISNQNLARGKELKLWLENAGLLARLRAAEAVRPWISTEALPVLPADCPDEYWVAYPDGTVGALYFGYRIEMDENWDDEEPYTGWMHEGAGEGLSTYNGPQPLYYKEMEAAPAAPTVKGDQPRV